MDIETILIENLITTLEVNKERFTGEDIKHVVDCIIKLKGLTVTTDNKLSELTEKIKKEWLYGGE